MSPEERILLRLLLQMSEDYVMVVRHFGIHPREAKEKYPNFWSKKNGLSNAKKFIIKNGIEADDFFFGKGDQSAFNSFESICEHFGINRSCITNMLHGMTQEQAKGISFRDRFGVYEAFIRGEGKCKTDTNC